MIRNGPFAGLVLLLLLFAAIAFTGKFRNNGDQLDELDAALSRLRGAMDHRRQIGTYNLTAQPELAGYLANVLIPAVAVPQSLSPDTVLFIDSRENGSAPIKPALASRRIIDSFHSDHFRLYLSTRLK